LVYDGSFSQLASDGVSLEQHFHKLSSQQEAVATGKS